MPAPSPDPRFASPGDPSQNAGHASAPDQPLPPPLSAAERGVAPSVPPMSVGDVDSHGGGIAIGPGATVHDQRKYAYYLPATPSGAPPFVVPYPHNSLFTGRDAELARIGELLDGGAGVAVVGTGGLGKTQLAAEYALAARARYPGGAFWLNMEQPEGIAGQVADLAGPGRLNLPAAPALDFQGKRDAVRAAWEEPVARLLIFDNLEDPAVWREWQPKGGRARVLITSRRWHWGATSGVEALQLQPLGRPASQELLLSPRAKSKKTIAASLLADPATAADADAICEAVGDLPLALALAGAYLELTPSVDLPAYREQITSAALLHLELDLVGLEADLPTGHEESILATFDLSYRRLAVDDTLAGTLLHRAARLAPAPIPRRLLLRAAGLDPDDAQAQVKADHALDRLTGLGLIEPLEDGSLRLHRLLAAFVRPRTPTPAEDSTAVGVALTVEAHAINEEGYPLPGLPYLPHLREVTAAYPCVDDIAVSLLHNLGYLMRIQGELGPAHSILERALAIQEQLYGLMDAKVVVHLKTLANLFQEQNELDSARPLLERALSICEQNFESNDVNIGTILNDLGYLMTKQGDLINAKPLLKRAIAIYTHYHGPNHYFTAVCIGNLAELLENQGKLFAAKRLRELVVHIHEKTLGPTHPYTAGSLNNLGYVLCQLGNPAAARPIVERALAIAEETWGVHHPRTEQIRGNHAFLIRALEARHGKNYTARAPTKESLGRSGHPRSADKKRGKGRRKR